MYIDASMMILIMLPVAVVISLLEKDVDLINQQQYKNHYQDNTLQNKYSYFTKSNQISLIIIPTKI
jgi:hypothetical protein